MANDEMSQQGRENHATLPEAVRFENALNIWVRDMRDEQLALVKKGGRLSVAALGYEEVLKLRGILGRFMVDRKRRIQGRWDRRKERREGSGKCESCRWPEGLCTAGRKCVAAGRDGTPNSTLGQLKAAKEYLDEHAKYAGLTRRERRAISRKEWLLRHG